MVRKSEATIEIQLTRELSDDMWELIEDIIANALGEFGLDGELTNSLTGNSTHFERK